MILAKCLSVSSKYFHTQSESGGAARPIRAAPPPPNGQAPRRQVNTLLGGSAPSPIATSTLPMLQRSTARRLGNTLGSSAGKRFAPNRPSDSCESASSASSSTTYDTNMSSSSSGNGGAPSNAPVSERKASMTLSLRRPSQRPPKPPLTSAFAGSTSERRDLAACATYDAVDDGSTRASDVTGRHGGDDSPDDDDARQHIYEEVGGGDRRRSNSSSAAGSPTATATQPFLSRPSAAMAPSFAALPPAELNSSNQRRPDVSGNRRFGQAEGNEATRQPVASSALQSRVAMLAKSFGTRR